MDFFYQGTRTINTSTPLGQWNVGGFREVAVHMWFKGPGGSTVYPQLSFNGLRAAGESVTIGPAGPGGWNIAIIAKVYPVFAPTMQIVLYNPSAQMDTELRLYATCCETDFTFARLMGFKGAAKDRIIGGTVDMAAIAARSTTP